MYLVTGSKGFIGSRLVKKLDEYIGIDTKAGQDILTCELPPEEDIDVIYHLAAHASVEESWSDHLRSVENLQTTVRLAQAYPKAKIIFASTGASLDPGSSPYAFFKKCASEYLGFYHKNAVVLVFPNIFGGPRSVVDIFKFADEVSIFGDGEQVRDYVHVDDIVMGLIKAQEWAAGNYFLGSGQGTTVLQLAEATGKKILWKPERKEQRESILPNNTPNWKPKIDVFEYIKS